MFQDKNVRNVSLAVLVVLGLFLITKTFGELREYRFIGSDPSLNSIITVSGKAERAVKPDIARFNFSVERENLVVSKAKDQSATTVNAIIDFLKSKGVDEKDIKTTAYNIYPRYEYPKTGAYYPDYSGERSLKAYVVSQGIEVKVRDINTAGDLLSGIGEIGATDVSGLSFEVDTEEMILKEIKEEAIKDARENAKSLAKALGVKISRVIGYNEGGGYPVYNTKLDYAMSSEGVGGSVTPNIPSGENVLRANVSITYEVK